MLKDLTPFQKLRNRIRKVNPEAASKLKSYCTLYGSNKPIHLTGKLMSCFTWTKTPEGHKYWQNIFNLIGETWT